MKAQKIAWEQRYSDDSGVEFAVRYDATKPHYNDASATIELEAINAVSFPASRLDWLIECLTRIKTELETPNDAVEKVFSWTHRAVNQNETQES